MTHIRTTIIRNDATIVSFDSIDWDAARIETVRLADDSWNRIALSDPVFMCNASESKPRLQQHTVGSIREDNEKDGLVGKVNPDLTPDEAKQEHIALDRRIMGKLNILGDSSVTQIALVTGESHDGIGASLARLIGRGHVVRASRYHYRIA